MPVAIKDGEMVDKVFGRLTVISRASPRSGSKDWWECRCVCGEMRIRRGAELRYAHVTSCGCNKGTYGQTPILDQMIGQKYGKLTVVRRGGGPKEGHDKWMVVVRCDCGTIKEVIAHELRVGHVKSCGCLKHEKRSHLWIDLTGHTYSRWTVIEYVGKRNGRSYWKCRCVCGNTKELATNTLRSNHSKSCGCLASEISRSRVGDRHPMWRGGKSKNRMGYVILNEKAKRGSRRSSIPEHIYVMEQHIGRAIDTSIEDVHHKNGVRDDNRIENLELRPRYHGRGQSVNDRVIDAIEILKRYRPEVLGAACGK